MPTWTPPGALGVLQLDDLLEEEEAEIGLWVAASFFHTVGRLFCVTPLIYLAYRSFLNSWLVYFNFYSELLGEFEPWFAGTIFSVSKKATKKDTLGVARRLHLRCAHPPPCEAFRIYEFPLDPALASRPQGASD